MMLYEQISTFLTHLYSIADVIDLINEALPFICDPIVMKSDEDRVQDCNALRLQHILDRLDQVLS